MSAPPTITTRTHDWDPPDDGWIDDYEAQFEDARDPFLVPDEPDDGR